ncbi:hypothetical protein VPH35_082042 [Triticum aestivum]
MSEDPVPSPTTLRPHPRPPSSAGVHPLPPQPTRRRPAPSQVRRRPAPSQRAAARLPSKCATAHLLPSAPPPGSLPSAPPPISFPARRRPAPSQVRRHPAHSHNAASRPPSCASAATASLQSAARRAAYLPRVAGHRLPPRTDWPPHPSTAPTAAASLPHTNGSCIPPPCRRPLQAPPAHGRRKLLLYANLHPAFPSILPHARAPAILLPHARHLDPPPADLPHPVCWPPSMSYHFFWKKTNLDFAYDLCTILSADSSFLCH